MQTAPSEPTLTDFVNNLTPQLKPQLKLHELDRKSLKEPTLVYARLMVQDIRDPYFYYSFIMKRPFQAEDKFHLFRWGNQPNIDHADDVVESNEYMKVMLERDQVQCCPVVGLTDWAVKI